MRILDVAGALCVAGVVAASAIAPASAAPVAALSAGARLIAAVVPVQFVGWRHGPGWHSGWRWGPYAWRNADDEACSGDHPPWASAYAGYPSFWCSPGFGAYYRHWPR
ncbi:MULTISPECIES: hypothetical protein [unclassified Bradyrhizobium]|uniref:hypothetical protein n=1 Tax=unclassified Bradyrhizobium TaxID=2631580 RepID=UPI0028EF3B4C|nr:MULTISPECIES: hypothetical protein [unclassified Bradyrhizobium]